MNRLCCIGDIHGDIERFKLLLRKHNLINESSDWIGGETTFVCTGDLVDRYKHGFDCIQLLMKLEKQAEAENGSVISLMGNHDALMIARVAEYLGFPAHEDCEYLFERNGGNIAEVISLSRNEEMIVWLQNRPLMCKIDKYLFQHCDGMTQYLAMGETIEEINEEGRFLARTPSGAFELFANLTNCRFWGGSESIFWYLEQFDCEVVIHGHTPFWGNEPKYTMDGAAINIDGGLSAGYRTDDDRGFILEL